jgi:hypothetical protein
VNEKEILRYQLRIPLLQHRSGSLLAVAFTIDNTDPCYGRKEEAMHTKMSVKSISIIGILVAMEIILARFSIHTWNLKIGFSFIPVVVAAIFYGPVTAGLVGAIGDIMGYILFPVGAYFPGFTLTAFVTGMIFGFFLRKSQSVLNIVLAVLCVQIFVSQFMTTYWISFLYGSPYWALFATRIYQTAAMIAVEIISTLLIVKKVVPVLTRE